MTYDSDFSKLASVTLKERMEAMHEDMTDMKSVLKELTIAINKLAVVEQRQAYAQTAIDRMLLSLDKQSDRVSALEQQLPLLSNGRLWVERGLVALAGAGVAYLAGISAGIK